MLLSHAKHSTGCESAQAAQTGKQLNTFHEDAAPPSVASAAAATRLGSIEVLATADALGMIEFGLASATPSQALRFCSAKY